MASPSIGVCTTSTNVCDSSLVFFQIKDACSHDSPCTSRATVGGRTVSSRGLRSKIDERADKIFAVYNGARNPLIKDIVLGNEDVRKDIHIIGNFGMSASSPCSSMIKKVREALSSRDLLHSPSASDLSSSVGFRVGKGSSDGLRKTRSEGDVVPRRSQLADDSLFFRRGGVVCDEDWSLLGNDAFILGGIHAESTFHLHLKESPTEDNLWAKEFSRPRVFGREILMLCAAGYRFKDFGDGRGFCFYKPVGVDTSRVTLESCRAAVAGVTNVGQILEAIRAVTDL